MGIVQRTLAVLVLLLVLLSGCAPDVSQLQKALQKDEATIAALKTENQQQAKDIAELKARPAAASPDLSKYATIDALNVALSKMPPPANTAELLSRLSSVEGRLITLSSQAATLQGQVTTAIRSNQDWVNTTMAGKYASKADLAVVQNELDSLQAPQVAAVVSQMNALSAQLVTAQQVITNLQSYSSQLIQLQSQITTLQTAVNQISALQSQVGSLAGTVNSLQAASSPSALIAEIQRRVDAASAVGAAMQTQVNMNAGNITLLQGQIATLVGQMADVQSRLASHGM